MSALPIPIDDLRCELEETLLCAIEDTLEAPANVLTPVKIKLTEDGDDGLILTVLHFEVQIDA